MYANSVDKIVYHQILGHDSCYQMCPKYVTLEIGVLGKVYLFIRKPMVQISSKTRRK